MNWFRRCGFSSDAVNIFTYTNKGLQSIRTVQCSSHAFFVVAQLESVVSRQQWCLFAAGPLAGPSLAEDIPAEDIPAVDVPAVDIPAVDVQAET